MKEPNLNNRTPPAKRTGRCVTAFTATEHGKGFRIMIAGCVPLRSAKNMPQYVRGLLTLKGRSIQVVDPDAKAGKAPKPLTDDACVVLFEQPGAEAAATGALYRNVTEMLSAVPSNP